MAGEYELLPCHFFYFYSQILIIYECSSVIFGSKISYLNYISNSTSFQDPHSAANVVPPAGLEARPSTYPHPPVAAV